MKITNIGHNTNPVNRPSSFDTKSQHTDIESVKNYDAIARDLVQVSREAQMISQQQKAVEIANASPVVDIDKVAVLQKAIANGSYKPDYSVVAEKMLEEEMFFTDL